MLPVMNVPPPDGPGAPGARLAAISRRAFLTRTAQAGAAALAVGLVATACSRDDGDAFASSSTTTKAAGASTTTAAGSGTTATTTGGPDLTGSRTTVRFTYAPSSGGRRVENPYIATWIEDEAGELVATLALWFGQDDKGSRYLNELRRWYSVDGSEDTIDTISSATRTPGDYSLAWDGTTFDGGAAPEGSYFLCIEAAREHGPYSLIRQAVPFGTDDISQDLPDEGELSAASVEFTAA